MINKKTIRLALQFFGSIIGLILLAFQIKDGFSSINISLLNFQNKRFLIISLVAAFLALIFQVLGWRKLLNTLGFSLPYRDVFFGYTFTFLPRYIPGSIWGYITRSEWLFNIYQIPYKKSLFISILEMIIIFLTNLALGFFILNYLTNYQFLFLLFFFLSLLLIIFIIFTKSKPLQKKFHNDYSKRINFPSIVTILLLFFSSWILYGVSLINSIFAFYIIEKFNFSQFFLVISINSISWVIGFLIIFVPAGIGVRELVLNNLLIFFFNLPFSTSSAIAIIFRMITLLAEFLLMVFGFFIQNKTKSFFMKKKPTGSNQ